MKIKLMALLLASLVAGIGTELYAQVKEHGDFLQERAGIHSGNRIRTTIFNTGWLGRRPGRVEDFGGEWPINSGHFFIGDVDVVVGAEVLDRKGQTKQIVVTPRGPQVSARTGQQSPDGRQWWTWEALPGYASADTNILAFSHLPISWPDFWPDRLGDVVDPGWRGSWNGYFGKNFFNADQESYYVMDDYNVREFDFYPDSRDSSRRGLALQGRVRGLQWSNVLAQNTLFQIFDFANIGTTQYDKMVFGMFVGGCVGGDGDCNDDNADFIEPPDNITFTYDNDNIGAGGYTPVGYVGYAFLESPGNARDGIDNDNDGKDGVGPVLSETSFQAYTITAGQPVVVIDYQTYKRTVRNMPTDSLVIQIPRKGRLVVKPSQKLEEIPRNQIDDNLNGLIDENNGVTDPISRITTYLYLGHKYVDYFTGDGLANKLIDERRDDEIDNDGNWDPLNDDVGLDGVPNTGDPGEGDGKPTSGYQNGKDTGLPGEPHIDKTDVTESDQIGLTSFFFFSPFNKIPMYDDVQMWTNMLPGFFNKTTQNVDGDFIYGSGYFSLQPDEIERFSMALVYGVDRPDIVRNKRTVQIIYNENYNFAKAPNLPRLTAVPGDRKVTLYWDDAAEFSLDVLSGRDFEGYKIYRATDPGWEDAGAITDAFGVKKFDKPIAQFDLKDDYKGFFPIGLDGAQFYLGENTGLRHTFVDSTVENGHVYFYAVTAYDHGDVEREIFPSETTKFASVDLSGRIEVGQNVAAVRPEAPALGFEPPDSAIANVQPAPDIKIRGSGSVSVEIVDLRKVPDQNVYQVRFQDTANDGIDNNGNWRKFTDTNGNGKYDQGEPLNDDLGADGQPNTSDTGEGDGQPTPGEPRLDQRDWQEYIPTTTRFSVMNVTNPSAPKTLVDASFFVIEKTATGKLDTIVNRLADIDGGRDFFDGMRVTINNKWQVTQDRKNSGFNKIYNEPNYTVSFSLFEASGFFTKGTAFPRDYRIEFNENLVGASSELTIFRRSITGGIGAPVLLPAVQTNFVVKDDQTGELIPYAFIDNPLSPSFIKKGYASAFDRIIFFEKTPDTVFVAWNLSFAGNDTSAHHPTSGDVLVIRTFKPFRQGDIYQFTSNGPKVNVRAAVESGALAKIKVVPNPYVVSATWEPRNPYSTGRGPRELHFIHLPQHATIRIYTVVGDLVAKIEHDAPFDDGTARWNMLTKDNLDIAYGVYIYHVEAYDNNGNKVGEKVDKFAVIK